MDNRRRMTDRSAGAICVKMPHMHLQLSFIRSTLCLATLVLLLTGCLGGAATVPPNLTTSAPGQGLTQTSEAGQIDTTPVVETPDPLENATSTPEHDKDAPTPEPTAPAAGVRQQYHLNAVYDHASRAMSVSERIIYTNITSVELAEIILVVEPNRYPGVFQPERLGSAVERYTLNNNRLAVTLAEPLPVGARVTLEIDYRLALPPIPEPSDEYKPVPFGFTLRQTNLVDWYPFIPPYQDGEGWLAHDPWFFGEHQVYESSDFEVEFQAGGSDEPLVLAASSLPVRQEGDIYLYRLDKARNFVLSISPFYQVTTEQVGETTILS